MPAAKSPEGCGYLGGRWWIDEADVDDGHQEGLSSAREAGAGQLRRRNRVSETELEILKRPARPYFARENMLPR